MKIETLSVDFTDEQKRYLEGFATGLQISKVGRGFGETPPARPTPIRSDPMRRISRRRTGSSRQAKSLRTRKNSNANNIRSMLIRG